MTTYTRLASAGASSAPAGSWIALLAATTFGDTAGVLRAEVHGEVDRADGVYRLVVQSYDVRERGLAAGGRGRPVGSVQRAVTTEELKRGVCVELVELRPKAARRAVDRVVVAWIEAGEPDLEFDGRTAKLPPDSTYGVVRHPAGVGFVRVGLDRRSSAQRPGVASLA